MTHSWLIEAFGEEKLQKAYENSNRLLAHNILESMGIKIAGDIETQEVSRASEILEMAIIDKIRENGWDNEEVREYCEQTFSIYRALDVPENYISALKYYVKLSCFGILGTRTVDAQMWLKEKPWPGIKNDYDNWAEQVFSLIVDSFLRTVRKSGWTDLEESANNIKRLRKLQDELEGDYLDKEDDSAWFAALELVALYHLAKAVEVLTIYSGEGTPTDAEDVIAFHFDQALEAIETARIAELAVLITWMKYASKNLIRSSVWWTLRSFNDNISSFIKNITSKSREIPILELWPSQRKAILEGDLLHSARRAVVVKMPTSSGKTLLAEFKILYTKQNFSSAWVAYIVPTRALVNQMTIRLRRDLGSLGIRIESAVPVFEIDPLEEDLLSNVDFDVLVTTPEKLDLLIRGEKLKNGDRSLGLVIFDEAHLLRGSAPNRSRALRAEMLLSTINREYEDVSFLLLSPFIPNIEELASWLGGEKRSAEIEIDWRPNEQLFGMVFPTGRGRDWKLKFTPLYTTHSRIRFRGDFLLTDSISYADKTKSELSKSEITSATAGILSRRGTVIVLVQKYADAHRIAEILYAMLPELGRIPEEIQLVKRFFSAEFGKDFDMIKFLDKGVAYHFAGISPEARHLIEWLLEKEKIRVLIATTTLAQGVNFPISSIVIHSYKIGIPPKAMDMDGFLNIAGRAGRAHQDPLGLIFFASLKRNPEIEDYVQNSVEKLISSLEAIVIEAIESGRELDFDQILFHDPAWSNFIQYLCHAYKQIGNHDKFVKLTPKIIRATYGYQCLERKYPSITRKVLQATTKYAETLGGYSNKTLTMVDQTGFSPKTINELLSARKDLEISTEDLSPSGIFTMSKPYLRNIIGALLEVKELSFEKKHGFQKETLAEVLFRWVSGHPVSEIAKLDIFRDENISKMISNCCRLINSVSINGSWGMGAITHLIVDEKRIDALDARERMELRAIPAMIFFGVNSLEGVVMRNLGVPRTVAKTLGELCKAETGSEIPSIQSAKSWLEGQDFNTWEKATPVNSPLSGKEYKKIWEIMNGNL